MYFSLKKNEQRKANLVKMTLHFLPPFFLKNMTPPTKWAEFKTVINFQIIIELLSCILV
jgi:hypothetical protein